MSDLSMRLMGAILASKDRMFEPILLQRIFSDSLGPRGAQAETASNEKIMNVILASLMLPLLGSFARIAEPAAQLPLC
jgi:hypothetical protein